MNNVCADVLEMLQRFHSLLCHFCTDTAALNLMVLKGFVLIGFWVYLLGVYIDPACVCVLESSTPCSQVLLYSEMKTIMMVRTMKIRERVKRIRIVFPKEKRKYRESVLYLYILLDLLFLRVVTHSYTTSVFAQNLYTMAL